MDDHLWKRFPCSFAFFSVSARCFAETPNRGCRFGMPADIAFGQDARGWQIPAVSGCMRIAEDGKYPRFQDARGLLRMANTRGFRMHEDC